METNMNSGIVAKWQPKKLDLGLSALIAFLLPIIAGQLYGLTGALIPMLLYYGLAWGLVKWRRRSTGYFNPFPKRITIFFYINVGIIISSLICAYLARNTFPGSNLTGIMFTALVWAPMNAASEQLLWIYIFEAWDLFPTKQNLGYRLVGLILFSAFVGMIHTMYWAKFLTTVDEKLVFGVLFILLTSVSGFLHLVVWRKSNHMIFTFIPHFLLNLIPIFWTGYSILPFLFR
ncbi:MAG: hypothetical protein K0B14_18030 [Anaerolineaceae bacterium]|nr:hypothetical protein [Anaerolineaceae bacterium]